MSRLFYQCLARVRPAPVGAGLKRLLRIRRRVVETPEGRFWIDPVSNFGLEILRDRAYESGMTATVKRLLRPGGVFVDVGANEGYFCVIAAHAVAPGGRVIAVEPQARLRPVLDENIRLNDAAGVEVAACAITDAAGVRTMHLAPDVNTGASGLERATRYRVATQQTPTITLEELLDRHGVDRVDLLKMDIEGFEYEAVLGSPAVFERRRVRAFALEVHPTILKKRGRDAGELHRFLADCGYALDTAGGNVVYTSPA